MSIQSDRQITYLCEKHKMISPFSKKLIDRADNVLSYGVSSYGYDITLGDTFMSLTDPDDVIDPKTITEKQYTTFVTKKPFVVEPGHFVLGRSRETFKIPRNMLVLATNKSTYARCGMNFSLITVLEPEWAGVLTIEIANHGRNPVKIYPGEGCMQLIFLKGADDCETSYAERQGKYQNQRGVQIPKVAQA